MAETAIGFDSGNRDVLSLAEIEITFAMIEAGVDCGGAWASVRAALGRGYALAWWIADGPDARGFARRRVTTSALWQRKPAATQFLLKYQNTAGGVALVAV